MFWSKSTSPSKPAKPQHPSLEDAPTYRILVVGNPGVGKTSFVHLLANRTVLTNPKWTCGCHLEVVAHTQENQSFVMELWDVGANPKFKKSRRVFYKALPSSTSPAILGQEHNESDVDGLILVHDLSNKKSYANLAGWLREVMREISSTNEIIWDHDLFFNSGNNTLPVIVVGTKADVVSQDSRAPELAEMGVDSVDISTQHADAFAPETMAFAKISAFFDKVILNREHQSLLQQRQADQEVEFGTGSVSPTARYSGLETFEAATSRVPQTHRHTVSTRNQRPVVIPRNLISVEENFGTNTSDLDGIQIVRHDIPHLSLPHSRMSQAAYTNILDDGA